MSCQAGIVQRYDITQIRSKIQYNPNRRGGLLKQLQTNKQTTGTMLVCITYTFGLSLCLLGDCGFIHVCFSFNPHSWCPPLCDLGERQTYSSHTHLRSDCGVWPAPPPVSLCHWLKEHLLKTWISCVTHIQVSECYCIAWRLDINWHLFKVRVKEGQA